MIRERCLPNGCPLKPSIPCPGTLELAEDSRCIGCPHLVQAEQVLMILHLREGVHA